MALKSCRECGEQVSTKAKTCPKCGAPVQVAQIGCVSGCLGLFVVVLVFGMVGSLIDSSPDTTGTEPTAPATGSSFVDMNAAVTLTGTQLLVTNNDGFAWTDCRITINQGLFGGGWEQHVARIGPGEQVAGGLLAFTRGNGERFQPSEFAVESATVACDTPSGDGFYSGSFR